MRLPPPKSPETGENLIPLINVIFLLLIFFMLAGQMALPSPFPVQPPAARLGTEPDGEPKLLIAADGRLALNGEPVTLDALPARLKEAGVDGDRPLRVKADGALSSERLLTVGRRLREAGVERVTLITRLER